MLFGSAHARGTQRILIALARLLDLGHIGHKLFAQQAPQVLPLCGSCAGIPLHHLLGQAPPLHIAHLAGSRPLQVSQYAAQFARGQGLGATAQGGFEALGRVALPFGGIAAQLSRNADRAQPGRAFLQPAGGHRPDIGGSACCSFVGFRGLGHKAILDRDRVVMRCKALRCCSKWWRMACSAASGLPATMAS
ncbi:hypothetical protein D3C72_1328140 [compost metagenome]